MKFKDIKFSKANRFAIGIEEDSGKHYISIPVGNQFVDYEEYYEISEAEFNQFQKNLDDALPLVERIRNRNEDERLLEKPGRLRGSPI